MAGPLNAFVPDSNAHLPGADGGPLSGLTFAAKDIFDVAGHVTGCGNPHWLATHEPAETTAWVVQRLVDAGASMVGKTITDELTRGIFGENMHYGTPVNPSAPGRVPGGSSSGSASAVAGRLVDFALGSDTGGSVRVPSSFCGLFGLRPTHGRIPLDGMLLQAPSFDTIGWFARDAETFARVGSVILPPGNEKPRPQRLVIAQDAWELAEPSTREALKPVIEKIGALFASSATVRLSPTSLEEWSGHQQVLQSREAWESARDWIDQVNPTFSFEVSDRYVLQGNRVLSEEDCEQVVLIPSGVEAFALDAHFQGSFVLQQVVSDLPQGVDVLRAIVLAHSALVFPKGHVQGPVQRVFDAPVASDGGQQSFR